MSAAPHLPFRQGRSGDDDFLHCPEVFSFWHVEKGMAFDYRSGFRYHEKGPVTFLGDIGCMLPRRHGDAGGPKGKSSILSHRRPIRHRVGKEAGNGHGQLSTYPPVADSFQQEPHEVKQKWRACVRARHRTTSDATISRSGVNLTRSLRPYPPPPPPLPLCVCS